MRATRMVLKPGHPGSSRGCWVPHELARPSRFLLGLLGGGEFTEGLLPSGAEGGDVQCCAQFRGVAAGEVEQRVGVGDAEFSGALARQGDLVAGLDSSLGEDTQVEAGAMVGYQQGGHGGFAQAHADAVAGDARLGDFEFGFADAVPVADAYFVVGQAIDGEVLPEVPEGQVVATELLLPVPVGLQLIDKDGTNFAAVSGQVSLTVSVDVQPPHRPGPRTGDFQAPVWTVLPCQETSSGIPTLTDSSVAIADPPAG